MSLVLLPINIVHQSIYSRDSCIWEASVHEVVRATGRVPKLSGYHILQKFILYFRLYSSLNLIKLVNNHLADLVINFLNKLFDIPFSY